MLQILLSIIGMTMAAALGYAMIQQSSAQNAMATSREDNRRLDLVADGIVRSLVDTPPFTALTAPVGTAGSGAAAWYTVPASLKTIGVNSQGIPFLYCPIMNLNQAVEVPSGSTTDFTIQTNQAGAQYNVGTYNGGIVWDNASMHDSVRNVSAVAIITSPNKGVDVPPPCSSVQMVNGLPSVPNGIARVITAPSAAVTTKVNASAQPVFYITQDGTGNKTGTNANNTATAEGVWKTLYKTRPATAQVYVVGNVTTGANFSAYAQSENLKNTELTLIGQGGTMTIGGNSPTWYIRGNVNMINMALTGQFYVDVNSVLQFNGINRIYGRPGNFTPIEINVSGKVIMRDAQVGIYRTGGTNNHVVSNNGEFTMINSSYFYDGGGAHYLVTYPGGYSNLINSTIGRTANLGSGKVDAPIYVIGSGRLSSTNSSVLVGTSGSCIGGNDVNNDYVALRWSARVPGTDSRVPPESGFAMPVAAANQADWAQYRDQVASRQRSREQHIGFFNCVN